MKAFPPPQAASPTSALATGSTTAAAAAAFAGIAGTGLAVAATQNRRADYDEYYGGPSAPAPYYYGGRPYYGGYQGYGPSVPYGTAIRLRAGKGPRGVQFRRSRLKSAGGGFFSCWSQGLTRWPPFWTIFLGHE